MTFPNMLVAVWLYPNVINHLCLQKLDISISLVHNGLKVYIR